MELKVKRGFIVYENGDDPLYVTPHSGPAIESSISRDDNSETVASLCFKKTNGRLIIGTMPRKRLWGIDFNRDIPSKNVALKSLDFFLNNEHEEVFKYMKKYAWVAFDESDYEKRLRIYQDFWGEVSKSKVIVLLHRTLPKIKNVPSVMDIVTFKGTGIKDSKIKKFVENINTKYLDFLEKIDKDYRRSISLETRRYVLNMLRKYNGFNPNEMTLSDREVLEKDLLKMKKYADKDVFEELQRNFIPQTYLITVENAIKNIPLPRVTIESVHDGSLALGPKRKLFPMNDKVVIEVESSRFMNFWHPQITTEMIIDIVKMING